MIAPTSRRINSSPERFTLVGAHLVVRIRRIRMQEKKHFGMMWHGQGGRILLIAAVKLVGGLILFFPYEARPDEVLREPPKLYSEQLAPLLTPKEQVLKTDQKSLEANVA